MAKLHYMALPGVGHWEAAIKQAGAQLKPYQDYLWTAIKAADRRKPVLGWRSADAEEERVFQKRLRERVEQQNRRAAKAKKKRQGHMGPVPRGEWIVLEPPPWRPEESDDTFEEFFDARSLHEDARCWKNAEIAKRAFDREGLALLLERVPTPVEPPDDDIDMRPTEARPHGPLLWLRPNTHTLKTQRDAIKNLEDRPAARHAPLTRLLTKREQWEDVTPKELETEDWVFLKGEEGQLREGTDEQRAFVQIALGTPDFALLEGPPGSGKTTAICELIAQVVQRGGRIILVASTHVAVDNVLERLLGWQDKADEKIFLPVRIGDEERVTTEDIKNWTFQRLRRTWRDELLEFLESPHGASEEGRTAREMLHSSMKKATAGDDGMVRLLLESANVVCGTTIGILQHPGIKASRYDGAPFEPFDMMILDEASKTTFAEFLVPAMHARRWIIVGDIKQLSSYVEETDLAENLRGLMPEENATAAVHAFLADRRRGRQLKRSLLACDPESELARLATAEAESRQVLSVDLDEAEARPHELELGAIPELLYADLVFGSPGALRRFEHRLPTDLTGTGGPLPELPDWEAARRAFLSLKPHAQGRDRDDEEIDWANEVAWRLVRSYELRQNEGERERYQGQLEELLPAAIGDELFAWRKIRKPRANSNGGSSALEILKGEVDAIRRVAMPSILELLQSGFERLPNWRDSVALNEGLPEDALSQRKISLRYQHRMHPHLSAFSREQFYTKDEPLTEREEGFLRMYGDEWRREQDFRLSRQILEPLEEARRKKREGAALLQDAATTESDRAWSYDRYSHRAMWVNVAPGRRRGRGNRNIAEVDVLLRELQEFVRWASQSPREDSRSWEIAVLTFYKGQEAELRRRLQDLSGQRGNSRNFRLPRGRQDVHITLCTVDRFQGHEADVVFLSFVKSGTVGFLNSPNRLNVALTRARYQIVLVGHRSFFNSDGCRSDLLRNLAASKHYHVEEAWEVSK